MIKKLILSLLCFRALSFADTFYIQSTSSLQSGATFYVSSGTATNLNVSTLTPVNIVGSVSGIDVPAGDFEEFFSTCANTVSYPGLNTFGDLVSTGVPAGDWDLSMTIEVSPNGATLVGTTNGVSTVSGNSSSGLTSGYSKCTTGTQSSASGSISCSTPLVRVLQSSRTTYYLKYDSNYSVATPQASGCLTGRRRH